jgi:hypothetical protein
MLGSCRSGNGRECGQWFEAGSTECDELLDLKRSLKGLYKGSQIIFKSREGPTAVAKVATLRATWN